MEYGSDSYLFIILTDKENDSLLIMILYHKIMSNYQIGES